MTYTPEQVRACSAAYAAGQCLLSEYYHHLVSALADLSVEEVAALLPVGVRTDFLSWLAALAPDAQCLTHAGFVGYPAPAMEVVQAWRAALARGH